MWLLCWLNPPPFGSQDAGRILVSVGINGPGMLWRQICRYENAAKLLEKRLWQIALSKLYSFASVPDALRTLCMVLAGGVGYAHPRTSVALTAAHSTQLHSLFVALCTPRVHTVEVDTASADQTVDGKKPTTNVAGQAPLDLDLDETLDDSTPFNAASLPLFVTLCDLGGKRLLTVMPKSAVHVALRSSHSILMVAQRLSWAVAAMDCTLPQRGNALAAICPRCARNCKGSRTRCSRHRFIREQHVEALPASSMPGLRDSP